MGSLRCRGNPRLVMDCVSLQVEVTGALASERGRRAEVRVAAAGNLPALKHKI